MKNEQFCIYKEDGRYGVMTIDGVKITKELYEYISIPENTEWFYYKRDGKWGFIDQNGNEKTPAKYDSIDYFSAGLITAKKDGKYGYIDKDDNIVIPFIYDDANEMHGVEMGFETPLASVEKDGKSGVINSKGEIVVDFEYEFTSLYKGGFIVGEGEDMLSDILDEKGNKLTEHRYMDVALLHGELFTACEQEKNVIIDKTGKIVLPIEYDSIYADEGMAEVKLDRKWNIIGPDGKIALTNGMIKLRY